MSPTSWRACCRRSTSRRGRARVEDDLDLVACPCELRPFGFLDLQRALVLLDALAANTRASTTMPVTPGGTLSEVSRTSPAFSPKMARSSFSSGDSCVSPFGVILPTRMSPGCTSAPMRTMPDSSRSLRASSPTFGNVARDLLLTELGVAGDALELLDVHRGEDVVLDDPLGEQDRVLEVVPTPRHERDEHVLAQRELARSVLGPSAITSPPSPGLPDDDRRLVDAGVLVGALELVQR